MLKPSLLARLTVALEAVHSGGLALCEDGKPVGGLG